MLVGVPKEMVPQIAVLRGRLAEALGREEDALSEYDEAKNGADRAAMAEARVRAIALRQKRSEVTPDEAMAELVTLAMIWRGDHVEVEAQRLLANLYIAVGKYRDAFVAARTATVLRPNAEPIRQLQDDVATRRFEHGNLHPQNALSTDVAVLGGGEQRLR